MFILLTFYKCLIMNAFIFIFALISKAVAFEEPMDHVSWNHCDVGTVLFSRSALSKRSWTLAQIAVLRARKHFLELIPPIHVLNTRSEDFTDNMLTYFTESFAEVKNEATDIETDNVLKLALSDAVGGYLKMWVLPITKFAYYGGTVPADDALKLYSFQEDLKKYLKTDGKGWRNPTADFLYSMSINIAPVRLEYPRKTQHSCEDIAYFERTKTGLAIPVPSVSWEKGFESMFFPIKNLGPISLNLPDSSDSLMKYYNIARYCIITTNLEDMDSYDARFQKWLDLNIIPHLRDDKLYPALRSVLSLVNKSRIFYTSDGVYQTLRNTTYIGGIPVDLSSKKMMVITVIIIIEIAWCIPTLCYLMFTRIRNKKKIKLYYQAENNNNFKKGRDERDVWNCSACTITNAAEMASKQVSASPSMQSCACLYEKKKSHDVDVETSFPKASLNTIGTATRNDYKSQLHPVEVGTNDQGISRKLSRQHAVPIGKSVSIKISNHSPDKTVGCNTRPHLTPVYDPSYSKTSVNSFTRYNIKKASTSFINTCCCKKRSSSTIKGSWCECKKASSSFIESSPCQLDTKANSSQLVNKDLSLVNKKYSPISKKESSSSLVRPSFCCNCNCKRDPLLFIKTSCSDSNCEFFCIPEEDMASTTGSLVTVQNLQPTQTVTLLQDSMSSMNDAKTSSYIHFVGSDKKEAQNANKEEKRTKKTVTYSSMVSSQELIHLEHVKNSNKLEKTKKYVTISASMSSSQESSDLALKKLKKPSSKQMQSLAIEKASKETMIYAAHKTSRPNLQYDLNACKKDLKSTKPLLSITIDKTLPSSIPGSPTKSPKPSKIPKRFFTHTVTQTKSSKATHSNRKSLIPQRKKHLTLDDIAIQCKKKRYTGDKDKLNVTL